MLSRVYPDVSTKIDASHVARTMFQSKALTLRELQSIQCQRNEPEVAAEKLLNIVMNQSERVFGCFLDALKQTGHKDVYKVIVTGNLPGITVALVI